MASACYYYLLLPNASQTKWPMTRNSSVNVHWFILCSWRTRNPFFCHWTIPTKFLVLLDLHRETVHILMGCMKFCGHKTIAKKLHIFISVGVPDGWRKFMESSENHFIFVLYFQLHLYVVAIGLIVGVVVMFILSISSWFTVQSCYRQFCKEDTYRWAYLYISADWTITKKPDEREAESIMESIMDFVGIQSTKTMWGHRSHGS